LKPHTVRQLRAAAGRILDHALGGQPQYVIRNAQIAVILRAGSFSHVQQLPEGFFREAYAHPDPERLKFERRMAKAREREH
jgi:hypothetical protein